MTNLLCDGSCENHVGPVVVVDVSRWGKFHYCQEAIAEDRRRGLFVTVIEENESIDQGETT